LATDPPYKNFMSLICVPVRANTFKELAKKVREVAKRADVVEVWMDGLPRDLSAEHVRKLTKKPMIAVCKGKRENGSWRGGETKRIERLMECAAAGMDYVDVDLRTRPDLIARLAAQTRGRAGLTDTSATRNARPPDTASARESRQLGAVATRNARPPGKYETRRTKLIVSHHDFKKTPSLKTLKNIYVRAGAAGADIVKLSVFANTYEDNLRLLGLGAAVGARKRRRPLIITSMGQKGRIGRIAAPLFGSIIVFAAPNKKSLTAPGQLTLEEYKKIASVINTD
jgi:3-dehydroquinate dehydratase